MQYRGVNPFPSINLYRFLSGPKVNESSLHEQRVWDPGLWLPLLMCQSSDNLSFEKQTQNSQPRQPYKGIGRIVREGHPMLWRPTAEATLGWLTTGTRKRFKAWGLEIRIIWNYQIAYYLVLQRISWNRHPSKNHWLQRYSPRTMVMSWYGRKKTRERFYPGQSQQQITTADYANWSQLSQGISSTHSSSDYFSPLRALNNRCSV